MPMYMLPRACMTVWCCCMEILNSVLFFFTFFSLLFLIVILKTKLHVIAVFFHNSITCSHILIHDIKSHYMLHVNCMNLFVMCVAATWAGVQSLECYLFVLLEGLFYFLLSLTLFAHVPNNITMLVYVFIPNEWCTEKQGLLMNIFDDVVVKY